MSRKKESVKGAEGVEGAPPSHLGTMPAVSTVSRGERGTSEGEALAP